MVAGTCLYICWITLCRLELSVRCRQLMDFCLSSSVTRDVSSTSLILSLLYSTSHRSEPSYFCLSQEPSLTGFVYSKVCVFICHACRTYSVSTKKWPVSVSKGQNALDSKGNYSTTSMVHWSLMLFNQSSVCCHSGKVIQGCWK